VTVPGNLDRALAGADAGDIQARLMLVTLCLIWGLTWPMMKIALNEIPPFSMRTLTAGIGALVLIAICIVKRRSLRVPVGKAWVHVVVASLLNMVGFTVLSAFAQIAAATSRVAILTYAMPIWAMLLTWVILRERPTRIQGVALALCVLGLGVLIRPLATTGIPLGLLLAIGSGFSWAAGTVYVKWARIDADPMGVASWQVTIAFFIIGACLFIFEGRLHLDAAHADGLLAVAFTGVAGNAIAYAMWFEIVRRVSAVTATLGILGIPVIGVLSSVLILGERPTNTDIIGFALIFAASACVLLTPAASASGAKKSATG
jgi:drug/metabolite transporter (DMT)-like permease